GATLTAEQMLALLRFDQHERWRSGQRIPAETYLQRYPQLQQDAELGLVVIYSEFLLRSELGEQPELEEYCWRFPAQAENLRRQHALNDAFLPNATNGTAERSSADTTRSPAPLFRTQGAQIPAPA